MVCQKPQNCLAAKTKGSLNEILRFACSGKNRNHQQNRSKCEERTQTRAKVEWYVSPLWTAVIWTFAFQELKLFRLKRFESLPCFGGSRYAISNIASYPENKKRWWTKSKARHKMIIQNSVKVFSVCMAVWMGVRCGVLLYLRKFSLYRRWTNIFQWSLEKRFTPYHIASHHKTHRQCSVALSYVNFLQKPLNMWRNDCKRTPLTEDAMRCDHCHEMTVMTVWWWWWWFDMIYDMGPG